MTQTRRVFHDELDALRSDVIRLGAMAGEAIEAATNAFLDADLSAVEKVVDTYLKLRKDPQEAFLSAYGRLGAAPFKEALYAAAA